MSFTSGQLFGAVIGGVAMAMFPPAALLAAGWTTGGLVMMGVSVGMSIGGIIDPPVGPAIKSEGPRLGDLNAQSSEWGSPIRRLFGSFKLSGTIIWALDLQETKHLEESGGGKGSSEPKKETIWYTYAGSWAVAFCEGEMSSVDKIWFDAVLVYDGTNYSGGLTATNHHVYLGTATQVVDWYIEANNPDTPAYRHVAYIVFNSVELENYGNKIPRVSCEFTRATETIGSISSELFLRAGLETTDFDTSGGNAQSILGYVVSNPMTTRAAVTSVTSAYQYELIESEFKLKVVLRNSAPVETNIRDILKFIEIQRNQTVELSKQINISYANRYKNYDAGTQSSLRIDSDSISVKSYQFAIAMSDNNAKRIAEMFLYSELTERTTFRFSLPTEYLGLEPSDVISIYDYDNNLYTVRLRKIDFVNNSQINCEAVLEDQTIYISTAEGSDTGSSESEVTLQGETVMALLDIPMLDNAYNKEGIYIAADGELDGWKGCGIDKSTNSEVTYNSIGDILGKSSIGETTTVLSSGPTTIYDTTNSVTVQVDGPLYDISLEVLLQAQNYIVIGDEILQYKDALDNNDGTYTLSTLLRGRRGTEWAIGAHAIGEKFVFLTSSMLFDINASLNVTAHYKATTFGNFVDDSISQSITPEIRCLKPLSPSYVYGTRDGSNNLTINWTRRSRDVTGYLRSLQLFEETESYEIEIVNADVPTFYTSTTPTYTYTNTQQLADRAAHTSGDPVEVIIYQISGTVARGYGTQEIL